jgi:hypothetical protein
MAGMPPFHGNQPGVSFADGAFIGPYQVIYGGGNPVTIGLDDELAGTLVLAPQAATLDDETHAALVVTQARYAAFDAEFRLVTKLQLRPLAPNPWEVAWIVWHYRDDDHFYSFVAKPNGWELGKEDPAYPGAQRYLATGDAPRFAVGVPYRIRVRADGARMEVSVDGVPIVTFTDTERPYRAGRLGVYCEDSVVTVSAIRIDPRR